MQINFKVAELGDVDAKDDVRADSGREVLRGRDNNRARRAEKENWISRRSKSSDK